MKPRELMGVRIEDSCILERMETEIEVRFLEIDKEDLLMRLRVARAEDKGESILEELIFYDTERKWVDQNKLVRLRRNGSRVDLTYKWHQARAVDGAKEIELEVSDMSKAEAFLSAIGLQIARHQEKRRHTFKLGEVVIDIDTWPCIPTYVELEGPSEASLRRVAKMLNLEWDQAVFANALTILEDTYSIPVSTLRWFTFERYE